MLYDMHPLCEQTVRPHSGPEPCDMHLARSSTAPAVPYCVARHSRLGKFMDLSTLCSCSFTGCIGGCVEQWLVDSACRPALAESQGLEIVVTLYHYIQLYNIFQDWNGQELGLNSEQTGH